MNRIVEWCDWCGVALILAAYGSVSFSVLPPTSAVYQSLNVAGSLAIAVASVKKKDYQPAALNAVWMLVALIALARTFVR